MTDNKSFNKLLNALQERAKELNCLYQIEELMSIPNVSVDDVIQGILEAIPPGWQYVDICQAKIIIDDRTFSSSGLIETEWVLSADVSVQERVIGSIHVYYTEERPLTDQGPFLKEEVKLIQTIADRLGHFILHEQMKQSLGDWNKAKETASGSKRGEWRVILDLIEQSDKNLYVSISHKMLNQLSWSGVKEAEDLLKKNSLIADTHDEEMHQETNVSYQKRSVSFPLDLGSKVFKIAEENLSEENLLRFVQRWVQEDKLSFLVQVVNRNLSLSEVAQAIRRFYHTVSKEEATLTPNALGITVSLIRRFLSDQLPYVDVAKHYMVIRDFNNLLNNLIFTTDSHGKLGGKSAGMYLAAQIINHHAKTDKAISGIKVPRTWYVTSDMLLHFMNYNNLSEIVEQKYKELDQVRFEYPHIIYTFKNSLMPPDMLNALSMALDDLGDKPLIVRSSSLLEDRSGAAFSGKYKSVFLPNRGSKKRRLDELTDAIAEVYASTFGPDPIEYRSERGLIDFGEEMGIMIQEVVGSQIGDYFMPAYAGVAFSNNEFRWSPRINREDGLVRLVPGLGTRAVDRLADDYPIMFAPGQPELRVNVSVDDMLRYSPRFIDVINLKKNRFETLEMSHLLREFGYDYPNLKHIISVYENGHMKTPIVSTIDFEKDDLIVTFDGLLSTSTFKAQTKAILNLLEEKLGMAVDIEFAHDGQHLYLLQCRPQSNAPDAAPSPIPQDVPPENMIFSANKYISNGIVPDISHIVYVNPARYSELESKEDLIDVGRAISRLNKLLPKRQFILMGPGRWGSRGDLKLGVKVKYSDINNTAILIEIAHQKGDYTPDLSFGTHFFQDLVEAQIRYIPLYPDDTSVAFNQKFLDRKSNLFTELVPEYSRLAEAINVIDVPAESNGQVLRVLMNAELDEAVGILSNPQESPEGGNIFSVSVERQPDTNWRWRFKMAEEIAKKLSPERFGVKAFYLIGSTKNATATSASDINILVHVIGNEKQRAELKAWLDGWSACLAKMNYLRTGYRTDSILDVHLITDKQIAEGNSYATKIGAITDAAKRLPLMGESD